MRRGDIERQLLARDLTIAGVDEVGRGCLAGPVFAAATVLDYQALKKLPRSRRDLIRDSKALTLEEREKADDVVRSIAIECYVSAADAREIEDINILQASFLAMRRALQQIRRPIDILLVDGKQKVSAYEGEQRTVIKGDGRCFAIAAASIIAKVARDRFMKDMAQTYPHYGFETNVGYGTPHHVKMIKTHGICTLHRRTFAPVRDQYQSAENALA